MGCLPARDAQAHASAGGEYLPARRAQALASAGGENLEYLDYLEYLELRKVYL